MHCHCHCHGHCHCHCQIQENRMYNIYKRRRGCMFSQTHHTSGVARVTGARGQTQNLPPPSKKFLKNDIEMSSIQLCL